MKLAYSLSLAVAYLCVSSAPVLAAPDVMTPLWSIEVGNPDHPYIANDGGHNSLAYSAVSGNLLVVSRTGGESIRILDGTTGGELGALNMTGISGGSRAINTVAVADDGSIYAANLTTDSTASPLKIYRWANESATPEVIYSGDPSSGDTTIGNRRFGDTLDARGIGGGVELVLGSRSGSHAIILSANDEGGFELDKLAVNTPSNSGDGIQFSEGSTFWAKGDVFYVNQFSFDLNTDTATRIGQLGVVHDYNTFAFGDGFFALLENGTHELVVYENRINEGDIVHRRNLPGNGDGTFNTNPDNEGAIAFGEGIMYVLEGNNGIAAFAVPEPSAIALGALGMSLLFLRRRK